MILFPESVLELALSDANQPPGQCGGQQTNTTCVWVRQGGGEWVRTSYRSMHKAERAIEDAKTLQTAIERLQGGGP
jgi:hypothetical protein